MFMLPESALNDLDDKRIKEIRPLIPPQILVEDIPLTLKAAQTIVDGRQSAESIIKGQDDRLLVIVGPCSIHDVNAAKEYGKWIAWHPSNLVPAFGHTD
jgi:3-deoxy-7-phosphoheptulonate synthase